MTTTISLACVTYNLNGRQAPNDKSALASLLCAEDAAADIVLIGLQEMPFTPLVVSGWSPSAWSMVVNDWMSDYDLVQIQPVNSTRLLGVHTLMFIKRKYMGCILAIDIITYRHSYLDNKATVGVSLRLAFDTRVTVVNTHMAAKPEHLPTRIAEYNALRTNMCFASAAKYISDDVLIMMGDWNSRTRANASEAAKIACMSEIIRLGPSTSADGQEDHEYRTALQTLKYMDQITSCRRVGELCTELDEMPITFAPTYRLLVGQEKYDIERVPSYCDRVMFSCTEVAGAHSGRPRGSVQLTPRTYTSRPQCTFSDHTPVVATFHLTVPSMCLQAHWLVTFEISDMQTFTRETMDTAPSARITFHVPSTEYTVSALDWIGIYAQQFSCDSRPVTYKYCAPAWQADNESNEWSLVAGAIYNQPPGRYKLGYYSRARNTLIGMSHLFQVVPS